MLQVTPFFAFGDAVFNRTRGWPMGGTFSEPVTLVDLGSCVHRLYTSKTFAKSVGLYLDAHPVAHTVQGLQIVDDAAVFSKVWCCDCLLNGVTKVWPLDVGTGLEEKGAVISFTSVILDFSSGVLEVRPKPQNINFASTLSSFPEQFHFPYYMGTEIHNFGHLRQSMVCRLVAINAYSRGQLAPAIDATAALVGEFSRLGWPQKWICYILRTLPKKHFSEFLQVIHYFGCFCAKKKSLPPLSYHLVLRALRTLSSGSMQVP